jgi:hypothetical protein
MAQDYENHASVRISCRPSGVVVRESVLNTCFAGPLATADPATASISPALGYGHASFEQELFDIAEA